jgi:predicted ATP-dependent endonuclease of OLD family
VNKTLLRIKTTEMYISKIEIDNYRSFKPATVIEKVKKGTVVEFVDGTNIIIGHNNAGKTNLLKAIQLVLDARKAKYKLSIDDFCKEYKDFDIPPEINISITLKGQKIEPDDHKVLVYDWITKLEDPYEAKLTFSFFLPQGDDYRTYQAEVGKFKLDNKTYNAEKVWRFIKKYYFSKYVGRVYGGNIGNKETASNELLEKFDFQFLDAIRDAEKQMFFGSNTILKDVLNYFLDYGLTVGKKLEDLTPEIQRLLKEKEEQFETNSQTLFDSLKDRISKDDILKYSEETGANKEGLPDLDACVSEEDLLFALRLIVKVGEMKIPISNNGLGYNNLLYAALVLAKMQIESESAYYGENAKVFPVLAIEEPEAHLHPSMQFKFLKFLQKNVDVEKKVRQLFVTSHSTHITSASDLDNIICLYKDASNESQVSYPAKAIMNYKDSEIKTEATQNKRNTESKNYVKRFLDATKSNMLFADKVILVEGLAEQLLLPCFAAYKKFDDEKGITQEEELTNQHVCIVSVDSRTFNHFLKLYAYSEDNPYAINKKVVCITDADPTINGKACFPFQLNGQGTALASHLTTLQTNFEQKFNNINIFHPVEGKGKTLEYELVGCNPKSELILTSSFPSQNSANTIDNFKLLQTELDTTPDDYKKIAVKYREFGLTEKQEERLNKYCQCLDAAGIENDEKSIALLSALYYNIVSDIKGEHSMLLEANLREDLEKEIPEFKVPNYITDALTKILE